MAYISSLRELYLGALLLALFVAIGAAVPQEMAAGGVPSPVCCVCANGDCPQGVAGCTEACSSKGGPRCQLKYPCPSSCGADDCPCIDDEDCDDGNDCTDDTCDVSGVCQHENITGSCNDGNPCTEGDTCSAGTCTGTLKNCSDGIECTDDSCNPANGNCQNTPNDSYCNDSNVCTTDYCQAVDCAGAEGAELVLCNTAGGCVHEPNTASCNDGNPCTEGDTCSAGTCTGAPKNCSDGNVCTDDTCDGSGVCQHANNTDPCDDVDPCTENDTCSAGTCTGAPRNCADADPCSVDTCDASGYCFHRWVDSDGDGVPDGCDEHPSIFDPTGCLYDEATGRVIPGGLVTPSGGPGTIDVGLTGANGCYQFSVTGLPADPNSALYTLSVTLPPNCVRSTACFEDPNAPLDPTGHKDPYVLGPYDDAGSINPHDCASNRFYLSFELSAGDPTILNNNIPLECEFVAPAVPAPAMAPWGIAVAILLLLVSAFVALRVRRNEG